uniref:Uncharacterized protein n=1 Tax=Oryza glumipatula TaxID=40148 RepID=A0A0D9Z1R2_9ORYZ
MARRARSIWSGSAAGEWWGKRRLGFGNGSGFVFDRFGSCRVGVSVTVSLDGEVVGLDGKPLDLARVHYHRQTTARLTTTSLPHAFSPPPLLSRTLSPSPDHDFLLIAQLLYPSPRFGAPLASAAPAPSLCRHCPSAPLPKPLSSTTEGVVEVIRGSGVVVVGVVVEVVGGAVVIVVIEVVVGVVIEVVGVVIEVVGCHHLPPPTSSAAIASSPQSQRRPLDPAASPRRLPPPRVVAPPHAMRRPPSATAWPE